MAISVGIMGAAGFAGTELLRLIDNHPDFELRVITSDSYAGTALSKVDPRFIDSELHYTSHQDEVLFDCEAVFLAVPHTTALSIVPALMKRGISVFDLSADYRLKDPAVYEAWYGQHHTSRELLSQAVFGLPELFPDELKSASVRYFEGDAVLVACAGCYPTASSLAAFPAIDADLVEPPIIIDAISGVTGAGKTANERTHFCSANENLEAYGVGTHRHTPEIEQILGLSGQVVFTPHLAPLNRGLLSTVYLTLRTGRVSSGDLADLHALYSDFYRDKAFIQVLEEGTLPKTSSVVGTNKVQIGLALQEATGTLIAISAIDNLGKGAAGQAIQCANLVFALPEERGLGFLTSSL